MLVVDQRAFLHNVRTENLAQRRVHQVRRGVVQADTLAASLIDIGLHGVADFKRTAGQFTNMANCWPYFCASLTRKEKPAPFSSPLSPTWPPDSA